MRCPYRRFPLRASLHRKRTYRRTLLLPRFQGRRAQPPFLIRLRSKTLNPCSRSTMSRPSCPYRFFQRETRPLARSGVAGVSIASPRENAALRVGNAFPGPATSELTHRASGSSASRASGKTSKIFAAEDLVRRYVCGAARQRIRIGPARISAIWVTTGAKATGCLPRPET